MKFLYGFLLSVALFFGLSSLVSADEISSNYSIYEPYYVPDDFYGSWEIYDMPSLFLESGDSSITQKDEIMNSSSMEYRFTYPNGTDLVKGTFGFGVYYGYNHISYGVFTIQNDGQPLFDSPGTLYLSLWYCGYSGTVGFTYSDGTTDYYTLPTYVDDNGSTSYIIVPNPEASLIKIQLSASVRPDFGYGTYLGVTFNDYGYILDKSPVVPEPDTPIVVPGDTSGVITFCLSFCIQFIESLFLLEIVSGVTYGYFILACMILSVIFGFLFSRLVR